MHFYAILNEERPLRSIELDPIDSKGPPNVKSNSFLSKSPNAKDGKNQLALFAEILPKITDA
jgi:hypothetical protein